MNKKLDENTPAAVVTGGGKRIGRELALGLAEMGYRVVVHYNRSRNEAEEVCRLIRDSGGEAVTVEADLRSQSTADQAAGGVSARKAMIEDVIGNVTGTVIEAGYQAFGRLDGLVNSAGVFEAGDWQGTDEELWDVHHDINVKAPFFLTQHFGKQFFERMPQDAVGWVVNLIDSKAERPGTEHSAYFASKGGLYTLTKSLAKGMAPRIRVNGIAPGAVLAADASDEAYFAKLTKKIPLQRTGRPRDIMRALQYLAEADFVTGEILHVDGGELLL